VSHTPDSHPSLPVPLPAYTMARAVLLLIACLALATAQVRDGLGMHVGGMHVGRKAFVICLFFAVAPGK
jgi:hypothetical protein